MKSAWAKTICRLLVVLMIWTPYQIAHAGMIGTDQVVTASTPSDRATVLDFLSRADVANQLQALGLDASSAKDRVAAMTDGEVAFLAGRVQNLPAGGDTAGVLLLILIVAAVWWVWRR
ncbi:MAG TPA: PA2779 family protein [Burkholderiales bacterium]|nr:PA2779 family protein [Burkholderiales bacterium]